MDPKKGAEAEAWLRAGGLVVTASDRASRALLSAYHRARRAEGLKAWIAPNVQDWQSFARAAWDARRRDDRLVMSGLQEQRVWARIAGESGVDAAVLPGPRRRLAAMAMDAHALVCWYARRFLDARARREWQQDGAAFSAWLDRFEKMCGELGCVSASRVPLEAIDTLKSGMLKTEAEKRAPLLLYGFDRMTPVQKELFDAWGEWKLADAGEAAERIEYFAAEDSAGELRACAAWCRERLKAKPDGMLLVIAQDVAKRRGEMERAMLEAGADGAAIRFEFSLGVPLSGVGVARSARLMLRWLDGALGEQEMDWLFSTGYAGATEEETSALERAMRKVRDRSDQRPEWPLKTFIAECARDLPAAWAQRMSAAQGKLQAAAKRAASAMEWAEMAPRLLDEMEWQRARTPASAEFQATRRWQQVVEACGGLGFDGQRMRWSEFVAELESAVGETLFAAESEGAEVVIAGPAESAGLHADCVWFLGAQEGAWPARGEMHPLLPADVQRNEGMPHGSPQVDWDVARAMTERVIRSAPEVVFSYARQAEGVDARASRLVTQVAGEAKRMPDEWAAARAREDLTERVEDAGRIPLPVSGASAAVRGGASVLTAQSVCPFKSFATVRLGAKAWDAAELALTAMERGQLLHAVLEAVWNPDAGGIGSQDELKAIGDLTTFVAGHVQTVVQNEAPERVREQMGPRYLELEQQRLTRLVTAWLEFEKTRLPFTVLKRESIEQINIGGLTLRLRLDRLDKLDDGTLLVVDYKSGDVSAHMWDLPRMEDVQLPLYARFGLDRSDGDLGGLVFAKVRAGNMCFAGRVGDAVATLLPSCGRTALAKNPMTAKELEDWEKQIEKLARDFLEGEAMVDPIDPAKTCERCGLDALCRISEREFVIADEADAETEAGDE